MKIEIEYIASEHELFLDFVCDKCPAYKVMTDDDREEFND